MAKGQKTGGRKKGSPNKNTTELKFFFDSIDLCLPEKIMELLPALDDSKKVETLLKLMEYVYPKKKAIELRQDDFERLGFTDAISRLDI